MSELVSVKFIQANGVYRQNEIAGFPEHVAKRLLENKVARLTKQSDLDELAAQWAPKAPEPMVAIRFTKAQAPYRKDEIAGFTGVVADAYIEAGVAEKHVDAPAASKAMDGPVEDKAMLSPQAKKALGR